MANPFSVSAATMDIELLPVKETVKENKDLSASGDSIELPEVFLGTVTDGGRHNLSLFRLR